MSTALQLKLSQIIVFMWDDNFVISQYSVVSKSTGECPHGVMVKAMDFGIVVCEFKLQSRYYIHFQANTLGKGMNPLILPAMG